MGWAGTGNPFPIVGVGASAGGIDAITRLLTALPRESGLALVVVQHLDPHHESQLSAILKGRSPLEVDDATNGLQVQPNHVYVIQPNTNVAITDGQLSVTVRPDDRRPHYPIDHFLRSLAAVQGYHAVGVILSGTGSDGTLGLSEIKAVGGVTFAQDDQSAQHRGMPQSAVASGAVDLVLPPEGIAHQLAELPKHPYLAATDAAPPAGEGDEFRDVIAALHHVSGVDFSQYRDTTIKRRTARRMLLRGFQSARDYAQFLTRDAAEADALYRDVLINVTSFFREPAMFEELKQLVFPEIVKSRTEAQPIRIWVPGCSTGQEAYSLAIALLEFLSESKEPRQIQVFATDLGDPAALDQARNGVYPSNIESEVTPERLAQVFTKTDRGYRIQQSVRDLCVFARQNITVDPPFSRVDLISCRNVLIYMSTPLQERLLPVFHFALNRGGFLVLGEAETAGPSGELFEPASRTHKIYRRKETLRRPQLTFLVEQWLPGAGTRRPDVTAQPPDVQREADRLTLSRYAPPAVLVNGQFEVQQFRGRTAPFLEAPAGQPTTNILRMAREGLFPELRSALEEAKATQAPVIREHLRVSEDGHDLTFTLRVLPVRAPMSDPSLLVLFESEDQVGVLPAPALPATGARGESDVHRLRAELDASKEYLQSMLDAQDAANQELRSAHEEVLSSNEELQSTNEELETAKEELQSANEELSTVNEQFQNRNRELDILADELSNFIGSADVPMVTVGRDLVIRRMTPAANRAFNLVPSDIGRSIEHIKFVLDVDNIGRIVESVIASMQPRDSEHRDRDGRWWMLRVRPYLTSDQRIDGATLVAVNIDAVKQHHDLVAARDYALAVVQTVREPFVVLGADCRVGLANEAFYDLVGETREQTEGKFIWETSRGVWNDAALRRTLQNACEGAELVGHEIQRVVPPRGLRTLVLNARAVTRIGQPGLLLLSIDDVTDARLAERLRVDAETLRMVDRRKDEFLGILAHELRNPLAPMRFALELMRQGGPSEVARGRQVLDRQVGHMVRIVDDLLDVSRIAHGKVELRKEPLLLANVVNSAIELSRPAVDAARHTLTVSLPDEPVTINGDQVRLTQVFVNLLNNAVKFTPPGGHIWIIAERTGEIPERPDQVRVRVRDTGIGIAPEQQRTVFDMFIQGDRSLERTRGGLGVGLTLVRNLVALHGGSIDVWSDGVGRGSEFIVTLPIELAAEASPPPAGPPVARKSRPLRILVADDSDDGRDMLAFLLTREGHTVVTAEDGERALEKLATFDADVAVLDIGMPGLNGYDVVRTLRAAHPESPPLLIALSGLGQANDKSRALEAGFDQHFTKPVEVSSLLNLFAQRFP